MSKRSYPVWDYPSNTKQNLITPAKSPQERNRGVGIPQSQQSRAPTLQNTTPAQRGIVPERGQNARQNYKPPTRGRPASTGAQPVAAQFRRREADARHDRNDKKNRDNGYGQTNRNE